MLAALTCLDLTFFSSPLEPFSLPQYLQALSSKSQDYSPHLLNLGLEPVLRTATCGNCLFGGMNPPHSRAQTAYYTATAFPLALRASTLVARAGFAWLDRQDPRLQPAPHWEESSIAAGASDNPGPPPAARRGGGQQRHSAGCIGSQIASACHCLLCVNLR
ncbi:hypothetical protein FB451DRAFT_1264515 [Mycena latifolia]|nr:hypothetical protein FB451DRAFT_1264515 [Mycena latifolia]